MEPLGHTESLLSIEPIENMSFSERKRVFCSTKLEMTQIFQKVGCSSIGLKNHPLPKIFPD